MNLHCTIYSDNLNRDMVKGSDVIYLGNYTTLDNVIEQTYFNDSEFRLLGVHFPFDMIENILQAALKTGTGIERLQLPMLFIKCYINSPYMHSIILDENGPLIKRNYPLFMMLFREALLTGPLEFGDNAVWDISTENIKIQIISVYKYNKDKLQVEI
tara:strand:+ start:1201 stop:1671 length:471 start_codon:yes stop_codon:yes gene_type:complete